MTDDEPDKAGRALWLVGEGRAALREERLPEPGAGEVLVRARHGAISRGTESLVASGSVPESEWQRMRAPFQEGAFPFPVKYGYGTVGEIVEGGRGGGAESGADDSRGRWVFCLHPHQDLFVVPADAAVPIPEGVAKHRAVLAANMETALNVVWDAGILPGDRVAVVGGGVVGLLVAYIAAAIPGTETFVVDVNPSRGGIVAALGAQFAAPTDLPADCDVVVHTSASEEGLASAIAAAGFEARIVEASWYGAALPTIPLGGAFHSQRLSIVGSQVGSVPPGRATRWSNRRRLEAALRLLADPRLDVLFSGETAFADLSARYVDILADPATLCHRIRYD
ncbi:zinc-dependent alcohol dehydrogenase [Jiella sonneratiae]|uniref:zinc-dependent alcohol dehydrogenase n=1 Tax=Jiella sonneratiae TaxID=2816856 RepID=UPI001FDA9708|nr:zinc-binding alcohol dehydrogenase [Jiella sonneratiae]